MPARAARRARFAPVGAVAVVVAVAAAALLWWPKAMPDGTEPGTVGESTPVVTLSAGQRVSFGHASIDVIRESQVRWQSPTLHVVRGALSVEVDPSVGGLFQVALPEFVVEVVGTRFDVDERGVRVHEGRVRVREVPGMALLATLGPGDRYQHETWAAALDELDRAPDVNELDRGELAGADPLEVASTPGETNSREAAPTGGPAEAAPTSATREAAPTSATREAAPTNATPATSATRETAATTATRETAATSATRETAATSATRETAATSATRGVPTDREGDDEPVPARLARARAALAQGAVDHAEAIATEALRRRPRRHEAAEARTILAEAALVRGDLDRAAQLHLAVARAYPDLAAGETALFAAARLFSRAGIQSRGRALFEEYLERHPTGRFATQARDRLAGRP